MLDVAVPFNVEAETDAMAARLCAASRYLPVRSSAWADVYAARLVDRSREGNGILFHRTEAAACERVERQRVRKLEFVVVEHPDPALPWASMSIGDAIDAGFVDDWRAA